MIRLLLTSLLMMSFQSLEAITFQGYSKLFFQHTDLSNDQNQQIASSNRLTARHAKESLSAELSLQVLATSSDSDQLAGDNLFASTPYRGSFLNSQQKTWGKKDQLALFYQVDRLFLTYQRPSITLTLGRQSFKLGTALFINPLDIFNPFVLNSLDTEERPGIDAIRLKYYLGSQSHIDAAILIASPTSLSSSAFVLRAFSSYEWGDLAIIASQFRERQFIGFDLQSQWLSNGINLSSALVKGINQTYARSSLGIQRLFTDNWFLSAEYHHSTIGATNRNSYGKVLANEDWNEGQVFYVGRHYLSAAVQKELSALTNIASSHTVNLMDHSSLNRIIFQFNAFQDQYLDLGIITGQGGTNSEFRRLRSNLYASYRVYF